MEHRDTLRVGLRVFILAILGLGIASRARAQSGCGPGAYARGCNQYEVYSEADLRAAGSLAVMTTVLLHNNITFTEPLYIGPAVFLNTNGFDLSGPLTGGFGYGFPEVGFAKAGAGNLTLTTPPSLRVDVRLLEGGLTLFNDLAPSSRYFQIGSAFPIPCCDPLPQKPSPGATLRAGASFVLTAGTVAIAGNTNTIDTNGFTVTIAADVVSDVFGFAHLTKVGKGTLIVNGAYTLDGSTTILDGALQVGGQLFRPGQLTLDGGTLQAGRDFGFSAPTTLGANGGVFDTNGFTMTVDAAVAGPGSLTKSGRGVLALNRTSTYLGATFVNAGVLRLGPTGKLPTSTALTVGSGATFDLAGGRSTIGSLDGNGSVLLGAGALSVGANNASTRFGGTITGSGSFTKIGSGTLTLTGPNGYTGPTTISGGSLRVGAAGALPTGTALTVADGALLDGADQSVTLGSLAGNGTVQMGTGTLTVGTDNASTAFGGTISSGAGLTKTGSGTLTLLGTNSYSGPTTIAQGTLSVALDASLGASSSALVLDGGTLKAASGFDSTRPVTLAAHGGTVSIGDGAAGLEGSIGGAGNLSKTGDGTLMLSGVNTYSGGTNIQAGTLVGTSESLQGSIANAGLLAFAQNADGSFNDRITGAGRVLKTGIGTLSFVQPQTYTGLTEAAAGRLNVSGLGGSALIDAGAVLATSGPIAGSVIANGTFINNAPGRTTTNGSPEGAPMPGPTGIAGDLWLGPGATYGVPAGGSTLSSLGVGGSVTVAGAHLALTGDGANLARVATTPLFTAAGGTAGGFSSVDAPARLEPFLTMHDGRFLLTVERNDQLLAALAQTPNARAAGSAIDAARATATPDLHRVIVEVAALSDGGVSDALEGLNGTPFATMARASALDGTQAVGLVADRVTDLRSVQEWREQHVPIPGQVLTSATTPTNVNSPKRPGFWARSINDSSSMGTSHSGEVVNGMLIGVDRSVGRWLLGAFGGFDRGTLTGDNGSSTVIDNRYRFGAYGGRASDIGYVEATVGAADHAFQSTRHIAFTALLDPALGGGPLFGGIDRTAQAGYAGFELGGFVEGGLSRTLGHVVLQPLASLAADRVTSNSFIESGAQSIDLHVDTLTASSVRGSLGARVTRTFARSGGILVAPRVEARYVRELLDPTATMRAIFADATAAPFANQSSTVDARAATVSGGLVFAAGRRLMLSADYHGMFAPSDHRQGLTVGVAF